MGNEMGNNNTSGLKDEDNTAIEAPKESAKETSAEDNVNEESQIVSAAEEKDFHVKVNGLVSNDSEGVEDSCPDKKISCEREQEETEVFLLAESPKLSAGSNEAGDCDNEIEPACLSNETEHEKLIESRMEDILLETTGHKLQKQASVKKEKRILENPVFDTTNTPHDPEPSNPEQSECNQHELPTIHDHPSEPGGSESLLGGHEEVIGSSLTCDSKENGPLLLVPEAPEKVEVSSDTCDLQEEQEECEEDAKLCEAKDGDKIENGLSSVTIIPTYIQNGFGEKNDEGIPSKVTASRNDSSESEPEPEPEAISTANSLNTHPEVPETEDKLIVITEETRLVGKESENGEYKHDYNTSQYCEELMKESKNNEPNAFQSESIDSDQEDVVGSVNDPGIEKDYQTKKAKVAENGDFETLCIDNQNGISEEHCQDSKEMAIIIPELGCAQEELTVIDCIQNEDSTAVKKIVEEMEENEEYANEIETEGTKEKPLPVDQTEELPLQSSLPLLQSQTQQQESVSRAETVQSGGAPQSIQELEQDNFGEFLDKEASTFDSTNLIAQVLVSMNGLEADKPEQDVTQNKISVSQPTDQCTKVETSSFASCGSETRESVDRFSTDSDRDNPNVHAQMRKSPSFSLDLPSEERIEETDRTPLLYQDKAAIQILPSHCDVNLGNSLTNTGYDQIDLSKYKPVPVEEKVVTLERSDSEKSRTPFLGFLKEEEEAHIVVTPYKQDNHSATEKPTKDLCRSAPKEITSASSKVKEKRKARSSLFGTCMCCATVIN